MMIISFSGELQFRNCVLVYIFHSIEEFLLTIEWKSFLESSTTKAGHNRVNKDHTCELLKKCTYTYEYSK